LSKVSAYCAGKSLLKLLWVLNYSKFFNPLSREAEERVEQRSELGVSQTRRTLPQMHWRQCPPGLTHPVIALLDHPLFACGGKRVAANKF